MAEIKEYRSQPFSAEFELHEEANTPIIEGYAATFMEPYSVGPFTEQIDPKAFNRSLSNGAEVPLLVDHKDSPLAHTKSGTMDLATDSRGLHVRARLDPANPKAQELISGLRRGDLDKMSFAFRVPDGGDAWENNFQLRTIHEANIHGGDVSVVAYPANDKTTVGLRSADAAAVARAVQVEAIHMEMRAGRTVSNEALDIAEQWARSFRPVVVAASELLLPPVEPLRRSGHSKDFSKRVSDSLSL